MKTDRVKDVFETFHSLIASGNPIQRREIRTIISCINADGIREVISDLRDLEIRVREEFGSEVSAWAGTPQSEAKFDSGSVSPEAADFYQKEIAVSRSSPPDLSSRIEIVIGILEDILSKK